MFRLASLLSAIVVLGVALLPATVRAAGPVDLELVLAIDSSASVDTDEFRLQMGGMASAFRDPAVLAEIAKGPHGAIAVTVFEWSSIGFQTVDVPWTRIATPADAEALARHLEAQPRTVTTGATSISGALQFAATLFRDNAFQGIRRVIDLSGDGRNNQGTQVALARDQVAATGITINALAILNEYRELDIYFEREVIGGDGAFVEVARSYEDFAEAFRRKLTRELRNIPVGLGPAESGETLLAAGEHGARP